MNWIISPIENTNFIADERLQDKRCSIFITYQSNSGRKYVKQVECLYGRNSAKSVGRIIAWAPLPLPYQDGNSRKYKGNTGGLCGYINEGTK